MVMGKRVKTGGTYYKGFTTPVSSTAATYATLITLTQNAGMAAISFTPDMYGAGDTMELKKYDDVGGTGELLLVIAEDVPNIGKNASIQMEFPALMILNSSESLVANYINTASVAGNFYVISEFVGINKEA